LGPGDAQYARTDQVERSETMILAQREKSLVIVRHDENRRSER
jgi:hypothetical protein